MTVVWYAARAGGILAYLLLTASVCLGLLMSGKVDVRDPGAKLLLDVKDGSIRTESDRLEAVP